MHSTAKRGLLSFWLLAAAAPLAAQNGPAAPTGAGPAAAAAAVDPVRLAVARRLMGKVIPEGSYATIMRATMDQLVDGMVQRTIDLPLRDLLGSAGLPPEQAEKIGPGSLRQIMAIIDPAFDQRQALQTRITFAELITLISREEPALREGMAEAYAARFSLEQLTDIEGFFATPSGDAYARGIMAAGTDPAVMARSRAMLPRITAALPVILQKVVAASATLPKPRKFDDLTAAERAELARLIGVELSPQTKAPRT